MRAAHLNARRLGAWVGALGVIVLIGGCGSSHSTTTTVTAAAPATTAAGTAQGSTVIGTKSQVPKFGGLPSAQRVPRGNAVLAVLPHAPRATSAVQAPRIVGASGLSLEQYLDTIDNDVATFWQNELNGSGYKYTPATENIVTGSSTTQCSSSPPATFSTDDGPFYCPVDHVINLTVGFFQQQIVPIGSAATAVVVAHENAHRVQDVLGILQEKANGQIATIQTELQADCLAGVYLYSVYKRGLLQPGDVEAALKAFFEAGDPAGTPESDPQAHGTPQQRDTAFSMGYANGSPNDCSLAKITALL